MGGSLTSRTGRLITPAARASSPSKVQPQERTPAAVCCLRTEPHWPCWRLLTVGTRMELCRRNSQRGGRPRVGRARRTGRPRLYGPDAGGRAGDRARHGVSGGPAVGYGTESVLSWVRRADIDEDLSPGVSTVEACRVGSWRRRTVSCVVPTRSSSGRRVSSERGSTANPRGSGVHRREPRRRPPCVGERPDSEELGQPASDRVHLGSWMPRHVPLPAPLSFERAVARPTRRRRLALGPRRRLALPPRTSRTDNQEV